MPLVDNTQRVGDGIDYGFRRQATLRGSFAWAKELDASLDEVLVNVVCRQPANYT